MGQCFGHCGGNLGLTLLRYSLVGLGQPEDLFEVLYNSDKIRQFFEHKAPRACRGRGYQNATTLVGVDCTSGAGLSEEYAIDTRRSPGQRRRHPLGDFSPNWSASESILRLTENGA